MLQFLSKKAFVCWTIVSLMSAIFYFSPTARADIAIANNNKELTTLMSVWDKETELNYSGITDMVVYRSPSCGCCGAWIEHAQKHGFKVWRDIKTEEMEAIKQQYHVPAELVSCHTAIIDGYVMEGHIPANDIKRFLAEKPENLVGLTVPGMPVGTPGMEMQDKKQPFQVLAFNDKGEVTVFSEYESY